MEISRENVIKIFKWKNAYQALLDAWVPWEAIQDAFQFSWISDKNVPLFPYAESILFWNREKIDPLVVSDNFERAVEKVLQWFPSSKIIASSHMWWSKVSFIQKMSPDFFQDTETCVVVWDTNTDYKLAKNIQGAYPHISVIFIQIYAYESQFPRRIYDFFIRKMLENDCKSLQEMQIWEEIQFGYDEQRKIISWTGISSPSFSITKP